MIRSSFQLKDQKVNMYLGYGLAQGKLSELGVDVLNLFGKDSTTIQTVMLDDKTMLKVWYYYVKEELGLGYEEAVELLDETQGGLEPFKKAFWDMVVGFTSPSARHLADQMWTQAKLQLKKNLRDLSSASSEESE